ncbi:hypothetical protein GCM10010483_07510 [Actinokineospora diospyrosa]
MNMPTIDSTPANSGGRPDTVVPNTMSVVPAHLASSSAQAPCTTVLTVSPARWAASRSRSDPARSRSALTDALDSVRCACAGAWSHGTATGSANPPSTPAQCASAAALSCSDIQRR